MAKTDPNSSQIRRRHQSLPLVVLLLLFSFLIFCYINSLLPFSAPERNPEIIPSHHNFTFTIKVLTFDRLESLRRCLKSLSSADYGIDRVNLHIFLDHFIILGLGSESGIVDRKLEESERILKFVDEFKWIYGEKMVHYRTVNAGLQGQWLEMWWPGSDDEFVFVVEDDLEVSPLYYKFLKRLIWDYYYDSSNFSPWIFGASLQRPRLVPGKHGNKIQLDDKTSLFLYQLVGTWGQLLFPRPWKEFRLWYDKHKSKGIPPLLEGMVTNGWYKKMGEKIWTPWFIKFVHSRGYFNIYSHFKGERALSVSHRDSGVNYGKSAGPDSILMDKSSVDFNTWRRQPLKSLKWYDFCFREVQQRRVVKTLDELGSLLPSLNKQGTIIIVSLFKTSQIIARNLLCHFQKVNITNYFLLGSPSDFLIDLARLGHVVVELGKFVEHRNHALSSLEAEFSLKARVIKKSLESGYDTWLIGGDVVPVVNAFNQMMSPEVDFWASLEAEVFYARSSPNSINSWNNLINDVVASPSRSFISSAVSVLQKRGFGRVLTNERPEFDLSTLADVRNMNESTLSKKGKKMVFWGSGTAENSVMGSLMNMGFWIVDGDSSCTAVYCHR